MLPVRIRPGSWGRVVAVALPLALVAIAASVARTGEVANKTYRDPATKCSFLYFADWGQVPTEPTEDWIVAKFYDKQDSGYGFKQPSLLEVFRIVKAPGGNSGPITGGPDAGKPSEEAQREMIENAMRPRTAWSGAMGRLSIEPDEKKPDPLGFKKIVSEEKVEGKLWQFELTHPMLTKLNPQLNKRDVLQFVTLVTYEKDGVEYGLLMSCPGQKGDDYKSAFKRIGQSFKFFNERAAEVKTIDALKDVKISPKRKARIERSLVKGWGVQISPKKNYVVLYNTMGRRNDQIAKMIAERIESIREQVYEVNFPPAKPIDAVSIVRICGDRAEYLAYGAPPGSAGYWNSFSEELVFYDASPSKKIDDDTLAVLYHEAFHQFIFYSVGNVAPHSWFNEGHGDYYAGAKIKGGKFKIEPFDWRRGVVKTAVVEGPRAFQLVMDENSGLERKVWDNEKGYTPIRDLLTFSQGEYYSYPSVSYAQGWSLVYFLREVVPKKPAMNKKWGHILDTYFNVLKAEVAKQAEFVPGGSTGDGPDVPEPPEPPQPDGPTPPGPGGDDPKPPSKADDELSTLPPIPGGFGDASALKKAVEEAFKGVDLEEFEKAWAAAVKENM